MATSTFKSTTKRTSIGTSKTPSEDSATFNRKLSHQRSHSLSCFSRASPKRMPAADDYDDNPIPNRERFVNKVRGSGFPKISHDDLAVELFDSSADRSCSVTRSSEATPTGSASQRRGKSVSNPTASSCYSAGGRVVSKKAVVDEIEAQLAHKGFKVTALHGDKDQASQMDILQKFNSGIYHVLGATDVAARGRDIKSIKSVVNFDIAKDMDMHVHQIGRTGRGGDKDGTAYTLITQKEAHFAGELVNSLVVVGQIVSIELMDLAMKLMLPFNHLKLLLLLSTTKEDAHTFIIHVPIF
ncbi:hypothetical protein FF2_003067 [Malus domestica]